MAKAGSRATRIDLLGGTLAISREALDEAGLEGGLLNGDFEKLDFPDKHVDGTLGFRFYHHIPDKDTRERVVGELYRVRRRS